MFCFLRKIFPFRRHINNGISHSTSQQLFCVGNARYYCNSVTLNANSFTVSYLIDTCGCSPEEAASASKYVSLETREKPDLVINFLKNHGFSKSQIRRFARGAPYFLRYDPEKTFLPKIEFFISRGVSSSEIPKLLCNCPTIMRRSLKKHLIPSFDLCRDLFQSDDKLIRSFKYNPSILVDINTRVVPNVKLLREVGVPESNVIKLLQRYPRTMTRTTGRFKKIVKEVQEMEFDPSMSHFIMAVYALESLSKATWSKKVNVYKKWGWSDEDIIAAFRKFPFCIKASEDKINAIFEFLVHKLGCNSSLISTYPYVFGFSLKERIFPRGAVIQVLLSKGLMKKESLLSMFVLTEREFLKRFIYIHGDEQGSELLKLYKAKLDLAR